MKYMSDDEPPGEGRYQLATWPKDDIARHIQFMMSFAKKLGRAASWSRRGPERPDQAKRVRAGTTASPITDGVFPEAKEFLVGYWIVDVDSPERAYQIAAEASAAPGRAASR
jgi:hypothetical protein